MRFPEVREALIYHMRIREGKPTYRLSTTSTNETYAKRSGAALRFTSPFAELMCCLWWVCSAQELTEDPSWRSDDCCCTLIYLYTLLPDSDVMQYIFIAPCRAPNKHVFGVCYVNPIKFKCTRILRVFSDEILRLRLFDIICTLFDAFNLLVHLKLIDKIFGYLQCWEIDVPNIGTDSLCVPLPTLFSLWISSHQH